MWQEPAVEEGTAPAWDPAGAGQAGTAPGGIWAPGDLAQLMDVVDEVNHTAPHAPAPVPAPGILTANDLYTLAAIHHTGTLTPQIRELASSLYITSGAVRDRLEALGQHIQVLNAELILTGAPKARAAQVAGWLRKGAIPGVVAHTLPWPPPRHELTKDDHHTIAAIRQSGSLKPTVATLATTLGINQSAMNERLTSLRNRLGIHEDSPADTAARVADMLQCGEIATDEVNIDALTANDLYLLAAIHRTGSLTPQTRDLASSLYITTSGVSRRLEALGQHIQVLNAELVLAGNLSTCSAQVALWLREGAIPGIVANALPWPPPRHKLTKDDHDTIAAIRQSGSLNPAVATLATTLGINRSVMEKRLTSLRNRLGIQRDSTTDTASQIAAMLQRGEIPA
jgi:DNA-binding MarR family transcriptional regulator